MSVISKRGDRVTGKQSQKLSEKCIFAPIDGLFVEHELTRFLSLFLSVVGTAVVRPARRAADATRRVTAALSVSTKTGSAIISSAARVFRLSPNLCPP